MSRIVKKFVDLNDDDAVVVVGNVYPGDMIIRGGVFILTAWASTTPVCDMGFVADGQGGSADPNALGTAMDLDVGGGQLDMDELAATTNKQCTVADQVTISITAAAAITAGRGIAWFEVINENVLNDDT